MNVLIADCETDGFLDTYTKLWTIQLGAADGDDVTVYADQPGFPPLSEGLDRIRSADRVVFHNGLRFDIHAINRLYPDTLRVDQIYDTLIAVRLLNPEERVNKLEDWGERLNVLKGRYTGDFQKFDDELVKYAVQDIHVTRALYHYVEPKLRDWGLSVELEHKVAYVIGLQEQNGFRLNVEKARALEAELRQEMTDIERELQVIFPPIYVPDMTKGTALVTPKVSNRKNGYEAGCSFSRVKVQEFNPGSEMQIELRLKRKYKWKPRSFTPTGRAKVDEKVLGSLPYAEVKALLRYLRVAKQLGQISDGDNAWLKLVKSDGRVYGAVNTIGCATGRMSHFAPNMGQVDKKDLRMREVWEPRPGWVLKGIDADAIEGRMQGHYLSRYDGGEFIDRVLHGSKDDGTDFHSVNLEACKPAGLVTRDPGAKRLYYAYLYGAGDAKLGSIVREDRIKAGLDLPKLKDRALGGVVRKLLAKGMRGIDAPDGTPSLKGDLRKALKRGWVKGLDGRRIFIRSEHSALNFLLQGGGAVVMKYALLIFHFNQNLWEYGKDFAYCANVHDEVQIECKPELAEAIGDIFADCIRLAGERLNVRCPLAGTTSVSGANWKETH
jgi:DNA polymerase-1